MSEDDSEINTVDMKIYDMPIELKNKYISMAKLDYDNKVWKVLEKGMQKLEEERNDKIPRLEEDIDSLQKQVVLLKTKIDELEQQDVTDNRQDAPKTFGG